MSVAWFKFLSAGATGPFSGYRWPAPSSRGAPGDWTTANGPLDPCRSGLHLCRGMDLPLWFNAELYEVEAEGPLLEYDDFVVTARARLRRRVPGWVQGTAQRFSDACAWEVRDSAVQQLRRDGHEPQAQEIASCATVEELVDATQKLCDQEADACPLVGYALDAASFAGQVRGDDWATATASTSFIAATAARAAAAPGQRGAATHLERTRQARWLLGELALG